MNQEGREGRSLASVISMQFKKTLKSLQQLQIEIHFLVFFLFFSCRIGEEMLIWFFTQRKNAKVAEWYTRYFEVVVRETS